VSPHTCRRGAGFTLLEVAVALAILGVGVVTVLELFSGALRMETAAGTRSRAVIYARGVLDQVLTEPEMRVASDRGQFGNGYRWERTIREAPEFTDQEDTDLGVQSEITLFEIEVSVLWPQSANREGVYTIRTLKLAPRPLT
jgi:general secretion pathway protein I